MLYYIVNCKGKVLENKTEFENYRECHYVILGFSERKDILAKFVENLKFYRITSQGKSNTKEVIYDVPEKTLTEAGVIISIMKENDKRYLRVKKISLLVGDLKRPTKTYILGRVYDNEEAKDFSMQISQVISNSFTMKFTIDIDDVVKKTEPIIEVDIENTKYLMICGTGYRAQLFFEKATYKDLATGKKVDRDGLTLRLPTQPCKESDELLSMIEKKVCEIAPYNLTRFEIAEKLLYPKVDELAEFTDDDQSEE